MPWHVKLEGDMMGAETTEGQPADSQQQAAGTEGQGQQTPGPVPYERFAEVNTQLAEMKKWRAEQEKAASEARKAAEAAEAKRLAEQNEFKTLAEQRAAKLAELEPLGERVKSLETVIQGVYEARLKDLPEAARKAVEGLPGLSVEQKLGWLNENAGLFVVAKTAAPNINATETGTRPDGLVDDAEAEQLAAIYGVKAKYLKRG